MCDGAVMGKSQASKGGLGSAAVFIDDALVVAALVAVNAVGDILDEQGQIMAGLRSAPDSPEFSGMMALYQQMARMPMTETTRSNTVIGVIATNARLNKEEVNKVAQMAHDGLARAVHPAHTMYDGDTIFGLATGEIPANVNVIGAYAAQVMAEAIRSGVRAATSLTGVRAIND